MGCERTASTVLAPLLLVGGAVGSVVHALVATAWSPALWPARWFIELQATWDDGRYSPKVTWALTWFHELAVMVMAGVLVAGAARLVEARRLVPPEPHVILGYLGVNVAYLGLLGHDGLMASTDARHERNALHAMWGSEDLLFIAGAHRTLLHWDGHSPTRCGATSRPARSSCRSMAAGPACPTAPSPRRA